MNVCRDIIYVFDVCKYSLFDIYSFMFWNIGK